MKYSSVGIFVYNPYYRESFDELSWYVNAMKKQCKDALFIECENKSDIKDLERTVTLEEGRKYADTINDKFCVVSAKTGED